MATFYDFNLVDSDSVGASMRKIIERAAKLGYEYVAVDHKIFKLDRKTKIPPAPETIDPDWKCDPLKVKGRGLHSLKRLTATLHDAAQTIALRSDSILTYDLLAVRPTNEKMFHKACTELEIDIISCDITTRLPFFFKHHSIKPAIERGVHFEICYSPAIRDASLRKSIFHNALTLVAACKGKNIILSSDAGNVMDLRGPHDVANLGHLFGLTEDQAKAAVSSNCRAVLMHAVTRNTTIKSAISIQRVIDLAPEDIWKVKASLDASSQSLEHVKQQSVETEKQNLKRAAFGLSKTGSQPEEKKQKR
ncbi:ribonuclease P protein subunit p30-like [Diadema setosum]|uniref:ribonuclease P protein subunit p30-like n=1 Tax=Diadema setosum TaxID=31175 RepID=UPI003B3AEA8A